MTEGHTPGDGGNDIVATSTKTGTQLARLCSLLFHPFLMPVYGGILLLYGPTYISILPGRLKTYLVGVLVITTFLFPVFSIGLLKALRIIPDLALASRRERIIPLLVVAIGYVACYFLVSNYIAIGVFSQLLTGALAIILVCFIINLFWKISLHMAAIGGIIGMLLYVIANGYGILDTSLFAALFSAGLLGTARLYLGSHNILQILAGFFAGVAIMGITVSFF